MSEAQHKSTHSKEFCRPKEKKRVIYLYDLYIIILSYFFILARQHENLTRSASPPVHFLFKANFWILFKMCVVFPHKCLKRLPLLLLLPKQ